VSVERRECCGRRSGRGVTRPLNREMITRCSELEPNGPATTVVGPTAVDITVSDDTRRRMIEAVPANTRRAYGRQWGMFMRADTRELARMARQVDGIARQTAWGDGPSGAMPAVRHRHHAPDQTHLIWGQCPGASGLLLAGAGCLPGTAARLWISSPHMRLLGFGGGSGRCWASGPAG
jgi:hypothetical protein